MDYEKWFKSAKDAIQRLDPGTSFCVKNLFAGTKWDTLSPGEKKGFGRYFSSAVRDGRTEDVVRDGESKTHSTKYKRM